MNEDDDDDEHDAEVLEMMMSIMRRRRKQAVEDNDSDDEDCPTGLNVVVAEEVLRRVDVDLPRRPHLPTVPAPSQRVRTITVFPSTMPSDSTIPLFIRP